jgi:chromosome segregation ATPase
MKPQKTTAQPSVDLDATDEFPVLDAAAYEAEVLDRDPAGPSDSRAVATDSVPSLAEPPSASDHAPPAPPAAADSNDMLALEHWIAQKADELRAHHDSLNLAQRERTAAVARTDELGRELAATSAILEAATGRERALAEALSGAQETARLGAAELDAARSTAARLEQELGDARAAETRQSAALTASEALLERRAGELQALQRSLQQETSVRERLAAEITALRGQLADCVESLQSRESYRVIYESALQELEIELAAERDEGEQKRSALESRLTELTAQRGDVSEQLLTMQAALTAARQRAEADVLAGAAAAERQRELESAVAARQVELTDARLEIERNRALLADLTAALLQSQTMFADQRRLLEEREAAASTMAADHAQQAARMTTLRGQIEDLTARLAAPEAERRVLEDRIAALTREVAGSHSRLAHLESMNSELRSTVGQLDTLLAERDAELQRATQIASMNAYALGRVQSSIDELGRTLTASEGTPGQAQVSILTRIDGGQNHSVVLRGRTTIGRDHDNDLALAMRSVSRHHAVLIPALRTAFVQDLGSTNGVLVNQRRVRCARLEHGDVVIFGGAQFRYTVAPAPTGGRTQALSG